MSFGKCKLKQQWDTTVRPLEWPKPSTTPPKASEDGEHQELTFVAVGMQRGTASLEETWMVSHKTKHTLLHDLAVMLFGNYLKELRNLFTYKNLNMNIYI